MPNLKSLTPQQRALLVDALQQVEFKAGREVFKKGDPGTDFYIIREGTAVVRDGPNGAVLGKLAPGQHFGERALLTSEVSGRCRMPTSGGTAEQQWRLFITATHVCWCANACLQGQHHVCRVYMLRSHVRQTS